MKHLLIILLLFIGVKGMGQFTDKNIDFRILTTPVNNKPIHDTIRVIMLVCDTAYYKGMIGTVSSGDNEVARIIGRNIYTWWEFGYEVRMCHIEQVMTPNEDGVMWDSMEVFCNTDHYLDYNKKPLSKNIYVWMANTLNKEL